MKLVQVLHTLVPLFLSHVAGWYVYQAINTPKPIFSRRECWIIGIAGLSAAVFLAFNNKFHWIQ